MGLSRLALATRAAGGAEGFVAKLTSELGRPPSEQELRGLLTSWEWVARPEQLQPRHVRWLTWLILAGRGWGKSRTGAETVVSWVRRREAGNIALIAPTSADARDVMVEGPAGIVKVSEWNACPVQYEPSKRRLTWPNGARATLFSAEEPDRLRGPQHDGGWLDELAAWDNPEGAWDMYQFGLRLGAWPRTVITTTPRPIKLVKSLVESTKAADGEVVITGGSMYENAANLAPPFLRSIQKSYEGTRLGKQEIFAKILDDNPNALWTLGVIDSLRRRVPLTYPVPLNMHEAAWQREDKAAEQEPVTALIASLGRRVAWAKMVLHAHGVTLRRIVIGCDPSGSNNKDSDACGISVCGVGTCNCRGVDEPHGFVLDDLTGVYSPAEWGRLLVAAFKAWAADRIVAETNYGGALVEANLRSADGGSSLPYTGVHARQGKALRAEPVSALTEQGKAHHVGTHARLEDELCLEAGTLILTTRGQVPIECVSAGDMALTRTGWRRVTRAWQTGVANTMTIVASNGARLSGTASHPIFSDGQFLRIAEMRMHSGLLSCHTCATHSSSSTAVDTSETSGTDITNLAEKEGDQASFTATYGSLRMDRFRSDSRFITGTRTRATTTCQICAWSRGLSTGGSTGRPVPPSGISPRSPIKSDESGPIRSQGFERAPSAEVNFTRPVFGRPFVVEVAETGRGACPVYNLEVETDHEYFANGLLVHNCQWNPKDVSKKSPNRLDAMVYAMTEIMVDGGVATFAGLPARVSSWRRS